MPDHPSWPAELVEKVARQFYDPATGYSLDMTSEPPVWRWAMALDKAQAVLSALSGDLVPREEHERLTRALALIATTRANDAEAQADALAEALEAVRPVLARLLRDAGWFDHDLVARIDSRLASYRSSSSTE